MKNPHTAQDEKDQDLIAESDTSTDNKEKTDPEMPTIQWPDVRTMSAAEHGRMQEVMGPPNRRFYGSDPKERGVIAYQPEPEAYLNEQKAAEREAARKPHMQKPSLMSRVRSWFRFS
jgi:hypothetical protein